MRRRRENTASAGEQLEQLRQRVVEAKAAQREADLGVNEVTARVDELREQIVAAHAEGADTDALGRQLHRAKDNVDEAKLKSAGLARRVDGAERDVARHLAERGHDLIAELEPLAEATRENLVAAANGFVEAEAAWQRVASRHSEILGHLDHASAAADMPSRHGLESVVQDLRRANLTIPTPAPHWKGRKAHEQQEETANLIRRQRQQADEAEPDASAFIATDG